MLSLRNLYCQAGQKVLIQLDQLTARSGDLLGILGPNGAGKSSLLKCITQDLSGEGEITLFGQSLLQMSDNERARHVGVLSQHSELTFALSAYEVVALGLIPLSISHREGPRHIRHFMALTDCAHLENSPYPVLSGGEKQRVQLARVLLQLSQAEHSPLLLLDEPTSAQDLAQQHHIMQLTQSLCRTQDFMVLAVLHDLNHVLKYCNRCAIVANSKLVTEGSPSEILTPATVAEHWHYTPQRFSPDTQHVVLY